MTPLNEAKTRAFAQKLGYYMPPIDPSRGECAVLVMNRKGGHELTRTATLADLWEVWAREAEWHRNSVEIEAAMIGVWKKADPRLRKSIEQYLKNEDNFLVKKPWAKQYEKLVNALPCRRYTYECMPRGWRARFVRDLAIHRRRGMLTSERLLAILRAVD